MEQKDFYKTIADAIGHNEEENNYSEKGSIRIAFGEESYNVEYDIYELEGYEKPCFDVESSRCNPGGYYGLDTYVFDKIWVTDANNNDVDIDIRELTYVYNEDESGELQFEKRIWINEHYDNN